MDTPLTWESRSSGIRLPLPWVSRCFSGFCSAFHDPNISANHSLPLSFTAFCLPQPSTIFLHLLQPSAVRSLSLPFTALVYFSLPSPAFFSLSLPSTDFHRLPPTAFLPAFYSLLLSSIDPYCIPLVFTGFH